MLIQPDQARAMQALAVPATNPQAASLAAVKRCVGITCGQYGMLVDPADPSVSNLHLELTFDATLYTFDAGASGALCNFAAGGSPCPPLSAALGTFVVPEDDTPPGDPVDDATLTFTVTPLLSGPSIALALAPNTASQDVFDLLTVDFTSPIPIDLTNDQNVLELTFDLANPVPVNVPVIATYSEALGNHQFNQTAFTCDGSSTACSGVPNVRGADVTAAVPEPASATILGVALTLFGFAGGIARRRHPEDFCEIGC
jgi:hypothetical protein